MNWSGELGGGGMGCLGSIVRGEAIAHLNDAFTVGLITTNNGWN